MTQLFFTKEEKWLELWDDFLIQNSRGHHNQLSQWLQSYSVYGFDYQLLLMTIDNVIVGGCGIILPKFSFFKFVVVPAGPILDSSHDDKLEDFLEEIKIYATQINACCLQINLPYFKEAIKSHFALNHLNSNSFYFTGLVGVPFKYVISVNGFRFVALSDKNPKQHYTNNTQRNIAKSYKSNLEFAFAYSHNEIEEAYKCIENNALQQGYSVRDFNSFKKTLFGLVEKKQGLIAVCKYQNKIVGCLFLVECGNRFTYISGGIDRNYPDLKIGHFLHQKMIDLSIDKGYQQYDISVGGSAGVLRFKEGFGGKHIPFSGARYWILKPAVFKLFLFFEGYLKPHKSKIALLLSKFKNKNK